MVLLIKDKADFDNALKNAGSKLVVVDFTATWCGPCGLIAPFYEEQSTKPENANVVFLKVDVNEAQDVSESCSINCMPTFQFYKNGQKVAEFSGADKDKLVKFISTHRS